MEQMNQGVAEPFSVMELRYWTSNKNIMTKQEEFSCLRSFIMTLPKDSYLRPWLDSVSVEVSQMIKSDIFPNINISDTDAQLKKKRDECLAWCEQQRNATVKKCDQEVENARNQIEYIKQTSRSQLRKALESIL
jgi:hypothetical protein